MQNLVILYCNKLFLFKPIVPVLIIKPFISGVHFLCDVWLLDGTDGVCAHSLVFTEKLHIGNEFNSSLCGLPQQ